MRRHPIGVVLLVQASNARVQTSNAQRMNGKTVRSLAALVLSFVSRAATSWPWGVETDWERGQVGLIGRRQG